MHRNEHYAPHLWALFALLVCAYLLVYSGVIESGDSRSLFNMTASLYRYGDTLMDLNADQQPPRLPLQDPLSHYPLRAPDVEPMQSLAALPLYALADLVPGLGLTQTTWVFNILITAATACAVFGLGRMLGFSARTALATALAFGLCTAALPYSKTFFREPLSALTILLAFMLAEQTRAHRYAPTWVAALAGGLLLMLLTRAAAAFALPAMMIVLLPSPKLGGLSRRLVISLLVVCVVAGGVFLVGSQLGGGRYDIVSRLLGSRAYFETALTSYLTSIGGSIWGTSPVLLLGLPGCVLLWRRGLWRYALALPLLLLTFAGGYAAYSDLHWFGGLSWPPRFLIATIPMLMVAVLPIAEIAHSGSRRAPRIVAVVVFLVLCGYGLLIQMTAVSLRWQDYVLGLPPEALGTIEWQPGLTQVEYLRWVVIPQLWGRIPLDLAWVRADVPAWAVSGGLLLAACTFWLAWGIWRTRHAARWSGALLFMVIAYGAAGLRLFHDRDPYYRAGDQALHALVDTIREETSASDVVLLSNPAYVTFFMNYGKLHNAARIISLPDHPGDRPSPEQPPRVVSDNPELLVLKESIPLIHALAASRDRVWLVENFGPALPWSTRPVERYLASYFYPVRTVELSAQTRLIEFDTTPAPDPFGVYAPQFSSDLRFGDHIRLVGYDLPGATLYRPGDSLSLSLVWEATQPLDRDYVVGVYLRAPDGSAVAQNDSPPTWGFAPTSGWQSKVAVWDNRALRLPEGLPPGSYQVWVKVYGFDEAMNAVDLVATGETTLEGVIGVLEQRITIQGS